MPEMRKNPLTENWVIIAPERANRPQSHLLAGADNKDLQHHHECYFCYGNEHSTPPEVMAYGRKNRIADSPDWQLRVVSNKFPAVNTDNHFSENIINPLETNAYAEGVAEVIIETPHHSKNMAFYNLNETVLVINAYKDRYLAISKEKHIKYVAVFKNHGQKAGASISHAHSQIIGIPIIPPLVKEELSSAKKYFKKHCGCIYCDMIKQQLENGTRVVLENADFVCFLPYASRFPYETWILPKFHNDRFENINESQIKSLAEILRDILKKFYKGLDDPPYNFYIHTTPTKIDACEYYHWHIELIPKTSVLAGFELGTGVFVNISTPEENAKFLKGVKI